jgi:soluble lytic murein transglycosylase-like protein
MRRDNPRGMRAFDGWALRLAAALALICAASVAAQQPARPEAADATKMLVADAVAFEHGEGVPKDMLKAAALYCTAARAGNAEAQFSLGWMYANGRGVPKDDAAAGALFALAVQSGHAQAQTMVARLGARGELPDCMRLPQLSRWPLLEEPDPFAILPPPQQKIATLVGRVAPRYGIEPRFALAVIAVESNFEPTARSVRDARGLMQLVPATAQRFNVRNAYNVDENVRGGLTYLRWLLAYYRGRVTLVAAAYNAGEAAVDKYGGIPPYPETRDYVKRVMRLFNRESHPFDSRVAAPSPIFASSRSNPM